MASGLLKPLSYVLVIALGFLLRRIGLLKAGEHKVLSRIMINVTLPCAIVQAFGGFTGERGMLMIVGVGLAAAFLPFICMYLVTRGADARLRAYRMLSVGGANIGCFSMPLIQAFFGGSGAVVASLFDIGNATVVTGGSYAMTTSLLRIGGERESFWDIVKKFLKSPPFDVNMIMLAFALSGIALPQALLDLTRPAGQANGFIAMLTIGAMFEPVMDRALLRETARELCYRYAFAAAIAVLCYLFAPLSLQVRQVLVLLCLSPISSLAPVYTERAGADAALASFTNSASIAVSLVAMLALSMYFTL